MPDEVTQRTVGYIRMEDGTKDDNMFLKGLHGPFVAALFHDIVDQIAPENHAEFAATVLKPYVSPNTHWMIEKHGIFQGYYFHQHHMDRNAHDEFRSNPAYQMTVDFCHKYDQTAFDQTYDTMPIEAFAPMVHRILGHTAWGDHT